MVPVSEVLAEGVEVSFFVIVVVFVVVIVSKTFFVVFVISFVVKFPADVVAVIAVESELVATEDCVGGSLLLSLSLFESS